MKHVILGVPPDGEYATFSIALPASAFDELKVIMRWEDDHAQVYDFQLTKSQIEKIEMLLSEKLPSDDLDLFLTCNGD